MRLLSILSIHNLLDIRKPVVIFLLLDQSFYTLRSAKDLSTLPV
jgi:hypothetical protein